MKCVRFTERAATVRPLRKLSDNSSEGYAASLFWRLCRFARKPTPRPATNSGSVAGIGVALAKPPST